MSNLKKLLRLLRAGEFRLIGRLFRRWLWSEDSGLGVHRDLAEPIPTLKPSMELRMRPIRAGEGALFADTAGAHGEDLLDRVNARHLLESGLSTCYVAVDENDRPVFMQYLVLPDQNQRLEEVFGGLFPPLGDDEALIEFAYTLERYRVRGVMPFAVAQLAEEARRRGARRLVAYAPGGNEMMARFFRRIGFEPFCRRRERYRFFRRRIHFEPFV